MLIWKNPPGQLGKERGEGERTDRGEMRQDKQTAYLTLRHVRASQYWTECRWICVLILFYDTLILCQREVQDWNSFADSQTDRDLWDLCRMPGLHARTSHDPAACSEGSVRATDSNIWIKSSRNTAVKCTLHILQIKRSIFPLSILVFLRSWAPAEMLTKC